MTDPSLLPAATLLVWAIWSDRIKKRWPFVLAGLVYCLVGFAINISDVPIGVKYFGTFLIVAGAYAGFPGVVAWCVLSSSLSCARASTRPSGRLYADARAVAGWGTTLLGITSAGWAWRCTSALGTLEARSRATSTVLKTPRATSSDVSPSLRPDPEP